MNEPVKVGFCVAYDWELLQYALPLVYKDSDVICLSIDKDRMSWANQSYAFDNERFYALINSIDTDHKIKFLEEDFHIASLSPSENEVRQRELMAKFMGSGGWQIQLDCDEYFLNFTGFVQFLRKLPSNSYQDVNVCCAIMTLFKQVEGGFLSIPFHSKNKIEFFQIASRNPAFTYGRRNGYFNIYTDFVILHQSWARSAQDVYDKIANWGHKNDFDTQAYFERWNTLSAENYAAFTDFHPINPPLWSSLVLMQANSIGDLIKNPPGIELPWSKFDLAIKNNRNLARLRGVWHKLFRS